jgi:tetratricopeptide (TPR) repeat protein
VLLFAVYLPTVLAVEFASPTLDEASLMLDISPKQAQILSTSYLANRTISGTVKQSPSNTSNDSGDHPTRTPSTSVEALSILAQASWKLGEKEQAQHYLDRAIKMAQEYNLPYKALELHLESIRFQWFESGDSTRGIERLNHLKAQLSTIYDAKIFTEQLRYKATMVQADIASSIGQLAQADAFFLEAKAYAEKPSADRRLIDYHLALGQHFLNHEFYNKALSDLLIAYWSAIESNSSAQLAKANTLLANVFYQRKVYDQALIYLGQAADFYDSYNDAPVLAKVLKLMGDTYYKQGRFNLALVHYLNVLDHEQMNTHLNQYIEMRIKLAETYYQLNNYDLAEQYLTSTNILLSQQDDASLRARAMLLQSGLYYQQGKLPKAQKLGLTALSLAKTTKQLDLELQAYELLSRCSEQIGDIEQALTYAKNFTQLSHINQIKLDQIGEEAFRQQKEFVEQTLHLIDQKTELQSITNRYQKLERIAIVLFIAAFIFLLIVFRRGYVIGLQEDEIDGINRRLFTHSRSNLSNLRMLNANLPSSLRRTSRTYEQWHIGELIHEPLSDRLRFAMIDVPFLRNMYLQYGYTAGLELERAFGNFLNDKLNDNTRLFHFTDANLLYIEKNQDHSTPPEVLFEQIKRWINEFQPERDLNRIIRMGIADYPFLPRAYMMINERELLDILLMATSVSRSLSVSEKASHWVYLKAIDNAPAASFATDNIRKTCQQAINQGIIKVHSSCKNEDNIKNSLKAEEKFG